MEPVEEETPVTGPALSTGATLLNLAYTSRPDVGLVGGKYYFIVGDSASGKTIWSMVLFAEACINPAFADHTLIYDNVEDGMLMNTDNLFGEAVTERMQPPPKGFSETLDEFYFNLDDAALEAGWDGKKKKFTGKPIKPFIYILDSMDAITAAADDEKFDKQKQVARKAGKPREEGEKVEKTAGSYGMAKAKQNSESLRRAMRGVRRTNSILIIISQTRDSLYGKTRAGGRALRFYSTVEVWTKPVEKIFRTVLGKERQIGDKVQFKTVKNRITGRLHEVELDIYPNLGIDDLGACVDYLVEEGRWAKDGQTLTGTIVGDGTREKVIKLIEKRGLEGRLRAMCGEVWSEVEAAMALKRKNRYTGV